MIETERLPWKYVDSDNAASKWLIKQKSAHLSFFDNYRKICSFIFLKS